MALTREQLEELWPEGPVFAYRAAMQRLMDFEPEVACASTQAQSPMCFEMRLAAIGLFRVAAADVENTRRVHSLNPKSWLMSPRPVDSFAQIVLDGVR